jgi:hypothetical protein
MGHARFDQAFGTGGFEGHKAQHVLVGLSIIS